MQIHQTAPLTTSLNLIQILSAGWEMACDLTASLLQSVRERRAISKLPPHLLQDIGEIDHRPPARQPLAETLKFEQTSLETLWQRQP